MLTLTLREPFSIPVEAEVISPDRLAHHSFDEICAQTVLFGRRSRRLDELFTITGEPSDELELRGDLHAVKWIGRGMTRGRIQIHGSAGMHLGAFMQGGQIEVQGDVGNWLGAEMKGGAIIVHGNAGGQVGAAYRGGASGMSDGFIRIHGQAGPELGMRMKRGTIVVRGRAGDFAGLQMKGGTIILEQGAELRTGAWMARGTIISLQPLELPPTFAYACEYLPTFVNLYASALRDRSMALPTTNGVYSRFVGDTTGLGKGEVLIWNPLTAVR